MTTVIEISLKIKNHLFAYGKKEFELSMSTVFCRLRWDWLVREWSNLLPLFKSIAHTDELRKRLVQLETSLVGANIFDALGLRAMWYYWPFLQAVTIDYLYPLTTEEEAELENIRSKKLTLAQLYEIRTWLLNEASKANYTIGAGDDVASAALNLSSAKQLQPASIGAWGQILSTYELVSFIDGLIYDEKTRMMDALSPFQDGLYKSFYTVPFEISIEHMSQKYNVPIEDILTANNLQPPFFSNGKTIPCTVAGGGVIVNKCPIFLGDAVAIGSATERETRFAVADIIDTGDGMMTIVLPPELSKRRYPTIDAPYLRIYPPHTLRRDSLVKIPSKVDVGKMPLWQSQALQQMNSALLMFGGDIAFTDNDITINPDKGAAFVYGMQAVEQVVRHILQTKSGEIPLHPNVGIKPLIGEVILPTPQENALVCQAIETTIMRDPRFVSCKCMVIQDEPLKLEVMVKIQGADAYIPFVL